MKNLIRTMAPAMACLAVMSTTVAMAVGSTIDIPDKVVKQFDNQYPDAKVKKWEVGNGNYTALFKENGTTAESTYSDQGTWEKTVVDVKHVKQLPVAISTAFSQSRFHNYTVDGIQKISTPAGDQYILKVDNHNGSWLVTEGYGNLDDEELQFDSTGSLIKITDLNGVDVDGV